MRTMLLALALVLAAGAAEAQVDPRYGRELSTNAPGSADYLLPRYSGSFLLAQIKKDFDELALPMGKAVGSTYQTDADKKLRYEKTQAVEGRLTRSVYIIPEGRSVLEVVRNYTNELEGKGAKVLFQCSKVECGEDFHRLHGVPRALKPQGYGRERMALAGNVLEYVDPNADQRLWVGQWMREGAGDVYVSIYAATQTGGSMGDISNAFKGRVLVEARTKVFLDASTEVRARRRLGEEQVEGRDSTFEAVLTATRRRDELDNTGRRAVRREQAAEGALIIDTDAIGIDEVVAQCAERYRRANPAK